MNKVITHSPIHFDYIRISVSPSVYEKRTGDSVYLLDEIRQKIIDTTKKLPNMGSMYGFMLIRVFSILLCEFGNNSDAINYKNPGS